MTKTVRKVVLPVAGLGTRFLPATKAVPKEMLPVVDRPLIQWAVEEAAAAGCNEFIFVPHPISAPFSSISLRHRPMKRRCRRAASTTRWYCFRPACPRTLK